MHPDSEPLEEKEIKIADLKLIKGIWPFVKPYLWMLAVSCLLIFLVTFFDLLVPLFTQKAIDGFIVPIENKKFVEIFGTQILSFKRFGLIFLTILTATFIIDFFQTIFMEYTGQKIILNLRTSLFNHMARLPVAYYDQNSSGRLVARVAGDVENMNEMFTSILVFIFKDFILMIGIFIVMFSMNTKLTLYVSIILPVIFLSITLAAKILRKAFRTIRQKIAEINHSFSEGITGVKIIQTTTSNHIFQQRFNTLNFEHFKASMFQIKAFAVFMPLIGFLGILASAIIIYAGSLGVTSHEITLGELVAFLFYMKLFFRPLRELSEKFSLLQNALASAERIITVLNQNQAKTRISETRNKLDGIDRVEFKNISFAYKKDQQILKDLSFSVEKGRSLGIVGQTGSGKSTVINLLTGFYQANKGQIMINNKNHDTFNIEEIRNKTALVMQDPILFSGSVKENIQPSNKTIDKKALESSLMQANCDFLFEKHQGLDTRIEEGGRPLSSGEKQLVCIARAFAFNPDLIIFDEATSYMDSQSEQKVHDALKRLMNNRTSIIIAHRLSTVRECSNIILLRDGEIRESGSHNELAELKGEYFHLLKKEKI